MVGKGYSGLKIAEYNSSLEIVLLVVYPHGSNGYDWMSVSCLDPFFKIGNERNKRDNIEFERNTRENIEFGVERKIVEEVNIYIYIYIYIYISFTNQV